MLPRNYNRKLGYYQLDDEEFDSGLQAVLASKGPDQHVKWKFNNEFFSRVNWQTEPDQNLKQLYAERARQLRERYDHLILSYSGGSDSWTILDTFLANNIKLDEIVTYSPLEATKNRSMDPTNFDFTHNWQEYHLVIKHDLHYLATHHPEIKISFSDFSAGADKFVFKDDWQENLRSNSLAVQTTSKYHPKSLTDSADKIKNIAYIVGLEKPKICFRDGKFYIYFLDFVTNLLYTKEVAENNFWTAEFFYWAPESEKILRKQAHTIKRFFQQNPQFLPYISWPSQNPKHSQFYDAMIKPLIYPDWDLSKWQSNKPDLDYKHTNGYETPLLENNPALSEHIRYGRQEIIKTIDQKYARSDTTITGFVSDFYEI